MINLISPLAEFLMAEISSAVMLLFYYIFSEKPFNHKANIMWTWLYEVCVVGSFCAVKFW